jgi:hypothetical protein
MSTISRFLLPFPSNDNRCNTGKKSVLILVFQISTKACQNFIPLDLIFLQQV